MAAADPTRGPASREPRPGGTPSSGAEGPAHGALAGRLLAGLAVALLLLPSLSRPNAAAPDLAPRGWAPGPVLPLTLGPAAVTATVWTAYAIGVLAVVLALRARASPLHPLVAPTIGAICLLGVPTGSADHVNYAAYGRILLQGGNPWVESPIGWHGGHDPIAGRVEEPWTTEPSVYGPFVTLVHALAAGLGGESLRSVVWVWQVVVVLAWLAVRWLLRRSLPPEWHGRVDTLWTLNPLVVSAGVLGAHVDTLATALAVAAVAAAWSRVSLSGVVPGVLVGLAASTKVTYAVVLAAIVGALWLGRRVRPRLGPTLAGLGGGLVLVVVPLHAWSGPHTFDQLLRSRAAVSLATPWRTALQAGAPRWLISVGAALLAVALAGALLRLTRPGPGATWASGAVAAGAAGGAAEPDGGGDPSDDGGDPSDGGGDPRSGGAPTAFWLLAALATAYSLAASYTLPWYDLLAWGALPAVASAVRLPVLDAVALTRLAVVSAAYVPGRVLGMTEGVRTVTMGVRRGMAPWVAAALWAAVLSLAWRAGSGRPPGRRPRGS